MKQIFEVPSMLQSTKNKPLKIQSAPLNQVNNTSKQTVRIN